MGENKRDKPAKQNMLSEESPTARMLAVLEKENAEKEKAYEEVIRQRDASKEEAENLKQRISEYEKTVSMLNNNLGLREEEIKELRLTANHLCNREYEVRKLQGKICRIKKVMMAGCALLFSLTVGMCFAGIHFYLEAKEHKRQNKSWTDACASLEEENEILEEKNNLLQNKYNAMYPEYDFYHRYAVIVESKNGQRSRTYHEYGCEDLDISSFLIFNIDAAEKTYEPCWKCCVDVDISDIKNGAIKSEWAEEVK